MCFTRLNIDGRLFIVNLANAKMFEYLESTMGRESQKTYIGTTLLAIKRSKISNRS